MSVLVKSLKRLYANGKVSKEKLATMLESGKINNEEYNFIIEPAK